MSHGEVAWGPSCGAFVPACLPWSLLLEKYQLCWGITFYFSVLFSAFFDFYSDLYSFLLLALILFLLVKVEWALIWNLLFFHTCCFARLCTQAVSLPPVPHSLYSNFLSAKVRIVVKVERWRRKFKLTTVSHVHFFCCAEFHFKFLFHFVISWKSCCKKWKVSGAPGGRSFSVVSEHGHSLHVGSLVREKMSTGRWKGEGSLFITQRTAGSLKSWSSCC